MAGIAVVNASPLIYLARAGHLDLLRIAAAEVLVPDAVADEILARGPGDPTACALAASSQWLRVTEAPAAPQSHPLLGPWAWRVGRARACAGAPSRSGNSR